jgi:GT2 family glycosyltransferase
MTQPGMQDLVETYVDEHGHVHHGGHNRAARSPIWRLYRVPTNLYYVGGANWLMARVLEDWPEVEAVWLCNDDIEGVSPQMAEDLYAFLQAHPQVGMVSPALDGTPHVMVQNRGTGGPRDVHFIDVTCPMIRTAMWVALGGYDPAFVGFGADVDLCARARKAGWRLVVHDGMTVRHPSPGTTCVSQGTMGVHSDPRWVDLVYRKHGKDWQRLTVEGP